jgi:hypothetical protein
MDRILDNLYLGDIVGATSKDLLKSNGITHILTVCAGKKPCFPDEFAYKVVQVLDHPAAPLISYFESCIRFIARAMEVGGKVFVHCFAGVSRSATIVIAYLMKEKEMYIKDAYNLVKSKRSYIGPNDGFIKQLHQFQRKLQGEPGKDGSKRPASMKEPKVKECGTDMGVEKPASRTSSRTMNNFDNKENFMRAPDFSIMNMNMSKDAKKSEIFKIPELKE